MFSYHEETEIYKEKSEEVTKVRYRNTHIPSLLQMQ
jgi:hypothetical protein